MNNSSGKNPDFIPAEANDYLKKTLMRDKVKRLRRSPDVKFFYSIYIPVLRCTYYQQTAKGQKKTLATLKKCFPKNKMILKSPEIKNNSNEKY